jgi:hypothetical protein
MLRFTTGWLLLLGSVIVCVSGQNAFADDAESTKYDLRYKFTAGEVLRNEVLHRATVNTTIQGTAQTAETRTKSIKAWKIDKVNDDGSVVFTHSVESIDMWQRMQGRQEIQYNSETDETPPPGYEDVAKQVGVPLTQVTIDARGKILKREEKLAQPNTNPTQITVPLPAEPVAVGHKWDVPFPITITLRQGAIKKVDVRQVYELKSVATGIATIEVDTQILTPVNDPEIEAQLIQRMISGTMKFDIDAGRVIEQQTDLDRRVIGFNGPASSMHYVTRIEEKLLPANVAKAKPVSPTR